MSKYTFKYTETIGDRSISISTDVIYPSITAKELSELIQTIHELLEEPHQ
jgi:hypothetical protein